MTYRTIVIDYSPKAKKKWLRLSRKSQTSALRKDGEPITFSVTNSAKAIMLFRVPEYVRHDIPDDAEIDSDGISHEGTAEAVGEAE